MGSIYSRILVLTTNVHLCYYLIAAGFWSLECRKPSVQTPDQVGMYIVLGLVNWNGWWEFEFVHD
jgi:hypothetical protein